MTAETTIVQNQEALDQAAETFEDLGRSEAQSRLPEGKFELFVMDFKAVGVEYYPAMLKPLSVRSKKKKYTADDYLPFRFAVGRARDYILDAFGIRGFRDLAQAESDLKVNFLRETTYYRLKKNGGAATDANRYANWNPEEKGILIKRGHPMRVGVAGGIQQTGINDQNIVIRGPVALRVPTIVSAFQFHAWLQEGAGITNRNRMTSLYLAGGRQVPIKGGGDPMSSNRDG